VAALKERLLASLRKAITALEDEGIPFAVVGGLAVGVRAEPRITRDIDLVVPVADDAEGEAKLLVLQRRGFAIESVFERKGGRLSTVRTRHPVAPEVLVDFLLSNCLIEAEIVEQAGREVVAHGAECLVAQSWHLLAMKVLANRKKDQADIQLLIEGGTKATVRKAREALDLMQKRGAAPGRNLEAELARHIREVGTSKGERRVGGRRLKALIARNPRWSRR